MESLVTQLKYELEINKACKKVVLFVWGNILENSRYGYYKGAYLFINFILFSYYFFC